VGGRILRGRFVTGKASFRNDPGIGRARAPPVHRLLLLRTTPVAPTFSRHPEWVANRRLPVILCTLLSRGCQFIHREFPLSETTSFSLLERASASRDTEAWERLVAVYSPLLRRWLRTYEIQDADAEDVIQDVLSVILAELPSFQHNERVGAFRNWLRRILVNRLRGYWRGRQREPLATGTSSMLQRLGELEDDSSDASRIWNADHDKHVISQLLASVRPRVLEKTWEAFRRQVLEGKRADVVASELEIPINSVYVARSRVLGILRREAAGLVEDV
jgi:RNA polymerase sigma-70 factor (ECF subfamily)